MKISQSNIWYLTGLSIVILLVTLGAFAATRSILPGRFQRASRFHPIPGKNAKWTYPLLEATIEQGDKIIEAIERYKHKHADYPHSLYQLVPEYLSSIDNPKAGGFAWEYKVFRYRERTHISLTFSRDADGESHYVWSSIDNRWHSTAETR